ncbi:MAG: Asp-tRNA(Asn)/Glu-tRNA(Gln) amidotransferase subunit GatB [bacterium]|nr:Asp-tRNA(Asn)/Glu-tRNA(Gln) amidotransferase subunit GatB [bacterium]
MSEYILTVGLEIHVELATKTKMFCNSRNDSNEKRPNVNICPVCLGYPGTLPVINQEAVGKVLRLGVALDGEIADYTEFDRKNYFYPDIPKGYQISQYKNPLVQGGALSGVALTRIHLEEDTAKSIHPSTTLGASNDKYSFLDFNRAGVPLMELVTEPVIKTATEASNFARELQLLLKYLDVSGANMEKGEMRVEANISVAKVRPLNSEFPRSDLGTKVEVKNLNSFKVVEKAIDFEFDRQVTLLEKGEKVVQETRGWDENKEITFSQRLKESAHDYRYFPDPDLPKLFIKAIPDFAPEALRRAMSELPWKKRERYKRDFGLKDGDIEIYVQQPEWGRLLEEVAEILGNRDLVQLTSNYITSDLKTLVPARSLAEVVKMISAGEISSRGAKDILKIIQEKGGEPRVIANDKNLIQESDGEVLKKIAEEVLRENPGAPIDFLVGQAMKKTGGRANPVMLQEILEGKKGENGGV